MARSKSLTTHHSLRSYFGFLRSASLEYASAASEGIANLKSSIIAAITDDQNSNLRRKPSQKSLTRTQSLAAEKYLSLMEEHAKYKSIIEIVKGEHIIR